MKILDCTLRDGGFLNDWNFTDDFAIQVISQSADYIEIGYRMHKPQPGFAKFAQCQDNVINKIFIPKPSVKLTVMVDIKNSDINDFAQAENSLITAVRVTAHYGEVHSAIKFCENLKQKGYEVFLNLTSILQHKDFQALSCWENKNILEALYFADSFGQLNTIDIDNYFKLFTSLKFKHIGFHAHNSAFDNELALKNTKRAIDLGAYIVDVSKDGIGRGAGNLSREQLCANLNLCGF